MRKLLFCWAGFNISSLTLSFAQELKVYNAVTKTAIEDVVIYNSSRKLSVITDANGIVRLDEFRDEDSIFFQHPSYVSIGMLKQEVAVRGILFLKRRNILMEEVVISASKEKERKKNVPYMMDVLDTRKISIATRQTSSEILENTGHIMVQKSQGGGGSPVIRGFEANKVLLTIDGVRMNNAIYRSGHLQNSITIDDQILDRIEVIYGPTSVIYGSDALGGVVHYYTRQPKLVEKGTGINVNAGSSYASVNQGTKNHIDINIGKKKAAGLFSFTYNHFGDVRMGNNRNPFLADFGKCNHYAERLNGRDTTMLNTNPLVQKNTGYTQYDIMQKILFKPLYNMDIMSNIQYSTSSNIGRYDELNDYNGDDLAYAEYYYGPQNRFLTSLKTDIISSNRAFTRFSSLVAYQRIDEDRISRKFGRQDKLYQEEDIHVFSINLDFVKVTEDENILNYGLETQNNIVLSTAYYRNIVTDSLFDTQTRYPGDGSHTGSYSLYILNKRKWNDKNILSAGLRYNLVSLNSSFNDPNLPFKTIFIIKGALTGSLSYIYFPGHDWKFTIIASTGYRNPNVDDYGKVRAKDGLVTVPNNELKPEYSYNVELGSSKTFDGYIKIEGNLYYTLLTNAMMRNNYQLNGVDSMLYDGDYYKIITNLNSGKAYIYGLSVGIISDLNSNLSFKSTLNYTDGWDITEAAPMPHIPPVYGRTNIQYEAKKFMYEAYIIYSDWKRTEDLSPFGEDNEQEATSFGFPSWYTLNLRSTFSFNNYIQLQLAIENLFDKYFKVFASGVSAPGRNFIFAARITI